MAFCFILFFALIFIVGYIAYNDAKDYDEHPITEGMFWGTMFGFIAVGLVLFYGVCASSILHGIGADETEIVDNKYAELCVLPGTENSYIYTTVEDNLLYYNVISTNGYVISYPAAQTVIEVSEQPLWIETSYRYKSATARFFVPPILLDSTYTIQVPNAAIDNTYYLSQTSN